MTFFFLVVGLEAKRELDLGELRERRRLAIPVLAAIGGMAVPIAIYLAFNAGGPGAHGWGAAMSTDTAFALGALALLTPRGATRLRVFLLTLAVVDDLGALVVIATVYTAHVSLVALAVAIGLFGLLVGAALRARLAAPGLGRRRRRAVGGDVQVGHRPGDLRAGDRAGDERLPALARGPRARDRAHALVPRAADARARALRAARRALGDLAQRAPPVRPAPVDELRDRAAVRARQRRHPRDRRACSATRSPRRSRSASWSATSSASRSASSAPRGSPRGRRCTGRARRSAGRRSPAAASVAGIGFTVSLLISSLAFHGERLDEAKLGVLASVIVAPLVAWGVFGLVKRLPAPSARAPDRRHRRGHPRPLRRRRSGARPHPRPGRRARHARRVRRLRVPLLRPGRVGHPRAARSFGDDVRYVWRHLPLNDVHPSAQLAAEAAEAAAAQGKFWEMYDALLAHQETLTPQDLAPLRRGARPRRRALLGRAAPSRVRAARRRGRRRAPTRAASRARRPSSSTDAATTAPTTSTRSPPPSDPHAGAPA